MELCDMAGGGMISSLSGLLSGELARTESDFCEWRSSVELESLNTASAVGSRTKSETERQIGNISINKRWRNVQIWPFADGRGLSVGTDNMANQPAILLIQDRVTVISRRLVMSWELRFTSYLLQLNPACKMNEYFMWHITHSFH